MGADANAYRRGRYPQRDGRVTAFDSIATTLVRTAILNGVNPQTWLTDVLERMVRGEVSSKTLHTLLPWAWRDAQRPAAA